MPAIFRSYDGHGTLNFDFGLQVTANFSVRARSDAWITVDLTLPGNQQTMQIMTQNSNRPKKPPEATLTGQVTSPNQGMLTAPRLILNTLEVHVHVGQPVTLELSMLCAGGVTIDFAPVLLGQLVELRHGLTNFVFEGCQYTTTGTGFTRDKIVASLNGLQVTYKQLPNFAQITQDIGNDVVLTSECLVEVPFSQLQQTNDSIDSSLILLSLASASWIVSIYEDVYSQGNLLSTVLKSVKTMPYHDADQLIDIKNLAGCDLQVFLETCYPVYSTLKHDLGLDIVIEYYLQAKRAALLELRYLVGVVEIECLLSYIPSYFTRIGKWKKGSGVWDTLLSKILRRPGRRSLRRKMVALLKHFQVPYTDSELRFIKVRNRIVHTGRFPQSANPHQTYDELIHFLDRVILRLLGYQGKHYLNRLNSFQREILP